VGGEPFGTGVDGEPFGIDLIGSPKAWSVRRPKAWCGVAPEGLVWGGARRLGVGWRPKAWCGVAPEGRVSFPGST
jgi:hypothetical protein